MSHLDQRPAFRIDAGATTADIQVVVNEDRPAEKRLTIVLEYADGSVATADLSFAAAELGRTTSAAALFADVDEEAPHSR
jgi:hypothetical protein